MGAAMPRSEAHDPVRFLQLEVNRLKDENRDLKEELGMLRSSVRALSALQDVISRITRGTDVIALLDDLLGSALAVVGAGAGSLLLRDEDTGELAFAVVHGEARERLTGYRLPPGEGIAGWVAANRQAVTVSDVRSDDRFSPTVDETIGFQTRSMAAVPLLDGDRVLGVIEAVNKVGEHEFSEADHDMLTVVGYLAALAITRAESLVE
jgi:GAF domain-containing protein